jgi:hypothetical protein
MTDPDPATQHRQEVLNELLAVGMRFLHRIEFRAEAEPETMSEMAALHERVSRSVRRSIALRHHLDQAPSRTEKRTAARHKLIRTVEDAIDLRAETPEQAERLTAELHERLDAPELEDETANRPVEVIPERPLAEWRRPARLIRTSPSVHPLNQLSRSAEQDASRPESFRRRHARARPGHP